MKIAILGSAPSSRLLAPYADKSWEIWACSMDNQDLPRIDRWFEIHDMSRLTNDASYTPYLLWMARLPKLYLTHVHPKFKNSIKLPFAEYIEAFGPYLWKSTVAYMQAQAILELEASSDLEKVIGIWGVDMTSTFEYGSQRWATQQLIWEAQKRGIDVSVPFESDISEPGAPYGLCETSRMWRKIQTRKNELRTMEAEQEAIIAEATRRQWGIRGLLENLEWMEQTFMREQRIGEDNGEVSYVWGNRLDNAGESRGDGGAKRDENQHHVNGHNGGGQGDSDNYTFSRESIRRADDLEVGGSVDGRDAGVQRGGGGRKLRDSAAK
jgi:hypothetical protein